VIHRYDRERHRDHAYYFGGHDARVCAESFHAMSLWGLGLAEQAKQAVLKCIADARSLGHTFSLAHALNMGSITLLLSEDVDACRELADELHPLAERNKFPWPLAQANFLRGWLAAKGGDTKGIGQMLDALDQPSAANFRPMLLGLAAGAELRSGHADEAESLLNRSKTEEDNFLFYHAEMVRLRGEIMLAKSWDNAAIAEGIFREAMAAATRHSCRFFELRAASSLARVLDHSGRRTDAINELTAVYANFTEGFDTEDLRRAKSLLGELKN
jgi:hypothetical protein